jgi:hypothetical protein
MQWRDTTVGPREVEEDSGTGQRLPRSCRADQSQELIEGALDAMVICGLSVDGELNFKSQNQRGDCLREKIRVHRQEIAVPDFIDELPRPTRLGVLQSTDARKA